MLHDPDPRPDGERADDDTDLDGEVGEVDVDAIDDPAGRSKDPYQPL